MSVNYAKPQAPQNLTVALAYLAKHPGRKLFPCVGSKARPALKNNLELASDDPEQLKQWQREHSQRGTVMWACSPKVSGIFCLDADLQKPGAKDALDKLVREIGPDDFGRSILGTETATTPSGGVHLIFEGKHKFSQSRLGAGLDVPNYFMIPGQARADGKRYTLTKDVAANAAPATLQARVTPPKPDRTRNYIGDAVPLELFKKMLAATPYTGGPDGLNERHSYEGWLKFLMAAHEAARGQEWGYLDAVIDWSMADPNPDWTTPTSAEYIERKWQSFNEDALSGITRASWKKVLRATGNDALVDEMDFAEDLELFQDDDDEPFIPSNDNNEDDEDDEDVPPDVPAPALIFKPTQFADPDPSTIPPRDWLYDMHYIRKFVVADIAPGGTIKTSAALVEAVVMASGVDLLNVGESKMPARPLNVWYWSGEDTQEEINRRLAAVVKLYTSAADDFLDGNPEGPPALPPEARALLKQNLFVDTGRDVPIKIAVHNGAQGFKIARPVVDALVAAIVKNKIDVLLIDPFIDSHSISENDNAAIEAVVAAWREVCERANCCIVLIHHTRKGKPGQSVDFNANDARGATALVDAARSVRVYNVMDADEAKDFYIPASVRWRYVRVENGKPNMAARGSATSSWRYIESVALGNARDAEPGDRRGRPEDSVGVVKSWTPPETDPLADAVKAERIMAAARKLFDEGKRITKLNGPNAIKLMVPMFRSLTQLATITATDLKVAFGAAEIDGSWRYQDAQAGTRIKAGYQPTDAQS